MTGRFLLGLVISCGVASFVVLSVQRVRRRLVPTWRGPEAVLADALLVVSIITIVSNILGALGLFASWPLAIGITTAAAGLWRWGIPASASCPCDDRDVAGTGTPAVRGDHQIGSWVRYAVGAAVGVVAALWWSQLTQIHRRGIFDWDSLWYHLPMAATFVQTGHFIPLHLYDADIIVSTYPAGSDVFHAIGILAFGSNVASPLLNTAWAAVFVLATHVFGRRFGVGHIGTLLALTVLAFPVVVQLEAVSALAEMMALACLAAALAFAVVPATSRSEEAEGWPDTGPIILGGLATGLMASTKLAMLGPAVVLFAGLIAMHARRNRPFIRSVLIPAMIATASTGAFWYLRNLIIFGNPVPALHLGIGTFALPSVEQDGEFGTMLSTLVKGFSNGTTVSAMTTTFGPLWFVFPIVSVAVVAVAVRRRASRETIVIAAIGLMMFVLGLLTPQYTFDGEYLNLFANGRYLLAGLVTTLFGLVALVCERRRHHPRMTAASLILFIATVAAPCAHYAMTWWWGPARAATPWLGVVFFAILCVAIVAVDQRIGLRHGRVRCAITSSVGLGCAAVLVVLHLAPTKARYRTSSAATQDVYTWAQTHSGRTIAIEPFDYADFSRLRPGDLAWTQRRYALLITYPLYGPDGENRVVPVARFDGTRVIRPTSCAQWWTGLRRIGATDVVLWTPGPSYGPSRYQEWTSASSGTELIATQQIGRRPGGKLLLYRIDHTVPPTC